MSEFTFKDRYGNEWDLELDMEIAHRIDDTDFSNLEEPCFNDFTILEPTEEFFQALYGKNKVMVAFITAMLLPQIRKVYKIDPDSAQTAEERHALCLELETKFVKGFTGPVLSEAREALWGALADFFQDSKNSLLLLREQGRRIREKLDKEIPESLREEAQRMTDQAIEEYKQKAMQAMRESYQESEEPGTPSST